MMTERIYYDDAYATEFDATIVAQTHVDGKPAVILDRTCFYATAGGQQYDTGTLGPNRVVDVQCSSDGDIVHLLNRPLPLGPVHGEITWPRRFDHMQHHSGQHLLSRAFGQLYNMDTVSVHFGDEVCTLDLEAASVTQNQLEGAEGFCNQVILENRPIHTYWVDDEKAGGLPLRRPPQVEGLIRIVEIQDCDWSACGGTHVASTAEIRLVKLVRAERKRAQLRVHFLCGDRALQDYSRKHRLLVEVANSLDTHMEQAPELVARQIDRIKNLERQVRSLQEQQHSYRAQSLINAARHIGSLRVVAQPCLDQDVMGLKNLALALQESERVVALLGCTHDQRATVIFARSADVPIDVSHLLRESLARFGGGGGGRPDFAQGGGPMAEQLDTILADAVDRVNGLLQQTAIE